MPPAPYLQKGLIKHLAGEELDITVKLNPEVGYQVEVVGNLNREPGGTYPLIQTSPGNYTAKIRLTETGIFHFGLRYRRVGGSRWTVLKTGDDRIRETVQVDPAWVAGAVFYCVFVRFFKGKVKSHVDRQPTVQKREGIDPQELSGKAVSGTGVILPGQGGTFDDVKAHLKTLKEMGINSLYFNPIHLIGELYRGYNLMDQLPSYLQPGSPYSIKDYKSIDPELTYDKDTKKHLLSDPQQEFHDLVDTAHSLEMQIIMDLVFNHTAHDFVFQRIRPEWYLYKDHITSLEDPYLYPEDVKNGKPWGDPNHTLAPYDHGVWWEDCAQLNWEYRLPEAPNEPPPNYSLNEMWQYFKSIPQYWIKQFGVDGFRADVAYRVPNPFWKACISEAREMAKSADKNLHRDVIFIAESYTSDLEELQKAGFTAVYGDFSHKLHNPHDLKPYLDWIYNLNGNSFPPNSRWFHFPDSHDFDRSPRKVLGDNAGNYELALLANQSRWVLTATLPGMPLVFNGFEKIEWQPIDIWSYGAIDWEKDADLKDYIATVNRVREDLKPLQLGSYHYLDTNQGLNPETQLYAFLRRYRNQITLVIVNMDVFHQAGPATIYLPEDFDRPYHLKDHISGQSFDRSGRELTIILPPGQSHIFEVTFN